MSQLNLEYQKTNKYFAQVAGSLEAHARIELEAMGATVLQEIPRGLRFSADTATLYRIVYCSRLVQRVLAPLISFKCHSEKYLYTQALKALDWPSLFSVSQSFAIESNVSRSNISHSLYAGQLLKDAICDSFRESCGQRPDFSPQDADIVFNLHIKDNWATIALDLTGISMHKRGYRHQSTPAPLQETLAAAIVYLSGWDGEKPLLDPMCGSGTLLAEAVMRYCRIPAGYLRPDRGLAFLPDYDKALYKKLKDLEDSKIRPLPAGLISGSDIDPDCIEASRTNLSHLPGGENVKLRKSSFQFLGIHQSTCLITNPPYGVRLGSDASTRKLYNDLGDFLKQRCPDSEAYILCGNAELVSELRLRAHWKKSLKNADLEVKLAKILIKARRDKEKEDQKDLIEL
jgi:putative N6-adenine-specific DNA methylase